MVGQMNLRPGATKLIVNRAPGGVLAAGILEEIEAQGLELIGVLPQDDTIYQYDADGKPSSTVPDTNPVKAALSGILEKLAL
jgi:CO dehydrogenase maturation factor